MRAVREIDGKKVLLDTEVDETLIGENGMRQTRGTDLMRHKCKDKSSVFYLFHWTRWQGEKSHIGVVGKDRAQEFIEEHIDDLTDDEMEYLEKLGFSFDFD